MEKITLEEDYLEERLARLQDARKQLEQLPQFFKGADHTFSYGWHRLRNHVRSFVLKKRVADAFYEVLNDAKEHRQQMYGGVPAQFLPQFLPRWN